MLDTRSLNCIIVDDEPLARKSIRRLANEVPSLVVIGHFSDTSYVSEFMLNNKVDLIFLDIHMPGVNGICFAKTIPSETLVIFTTAYPEYALDSYEVDAIDYLIKPIKLERFKKAVEKAVSYHFLLKETKENTIETIEEDHIFVKSNRRFYKIKLEDILFIEGLKDYVVIQMSDKKIITRMYLKMIGEKLPKTFFRINKSFIVNTGKIDSFDNNDVYIDTYEIAIGTGYRDFFFRYFTGKIP